MKETIQSPLAENDVVEIWGYIANDNQIMADKIVDKIHELFQKLLENPKIGVLRKDLAKDLRSFPVEKYVVFYRIIKDGIEIVRVLHSARDISTIFD